MNFWAGPPVQNLTEMDESTRKRNGVLTMAQMTQNDPGSSEITSVLSSDENSTFAHFWPETEKSWKYENENTRESNWDLKSTWKSKSWNLEDQSENSEWLVILNFDFWIRFWIGIWFRIRFRIRFLSERSEPRLSPTAFERCEFFAPMWQVWQDISKERWPKAPSKIYWLFEKDQSRIQTLQFTETIQYCMWLAHLRNMWPILWLWPKKVSNSHGNSSPNERRTNFSMSRLWQTLLKLQGFGSTQRYQAQFSGQKTNPMWPLHQNVSQQLGTEEAFERCEHSWVQVWQVGCNWQGRRPCQLNLSPFFPVKLHDDKREREQQIHFHFGFCLTQCPFFKLFQSYAHHWKALIKSFPMSPNFLKKDQK